MKGYNVLNLSDRLELIRDLNVRGATQATANQAVEEEMQEEGVGEIWVECVENIDFNPLSLGIESDVNPSINEEKLVNVPFDQDN